MNGNDKIPPSSTSRRCFAGLVALPVVAGIWFLYLSHTGQHLLSDDWGLFSEIRSFGSVCKDFTRTWLGHSNCYYRPLTTVSLAVDHFFWGVDPIAFHRMNLALFTICAALVGWLAACMTAGNRTCAGLAAFTIFLLHPAAVEPASWICCRMALLSGLFGLTACLLFLRYLEQGRPRTLAALLLAQTAALLSREDALILPVVALLLGISVQRRNRILIAMTGMGAVVGMYLLLRILLGITMASESHRALLAPAMWGEACQSLIGHLSLLFLPHLANPSPIAMAATVASGLGVTLLCILNIRLLGGHAFLRIAAALVVSIAPALPARISLTHGSRVLFLPLMLCSVLLGLVVSGLPGRIRSHEKWALAALMTAGLAVLTLANLARWRDAGDLASRISADLHRLHEATPAEEIFLFVDPPRFHRGIPVLDQAMNSILEPPFVDRPRLLMSVFKDLAQEVVNRCPGTPGTNIPKRLLTWVPGGKLLHAPAPPFTSPILKAWGIESLEEWRPERTQSGCAIRSPEIGISPLVVNRLEVDLHRRQVDDCRVTLSLAGTPLTAPLSAVMNLHAEPIPDDPASTRLWIPAAAVPGVNALVRLDRVSMHLDAIAPAEIMAIRIVRILPWLEVDAHLEKTPHLPGRLTLVLGIGTPPACSTIQILRVRFYHFRAFLMHLDISTAALAADGEGRYRCEIPVSLKQLQSLGIGPHMDIFLRVDAYTGPVSPLNLRARSRPVRLPARGN